MGVFFLFSFLRVTRQSTALNTPPSLLYNWLEHPFCDFLFPEKRERAVETRGGCFLKFFFCSLYYVFLNFYYACDLYACTTKMYCVTKLAIHVCTAKDVIWRYWPRKVVKTEKSQWNTKREQQFYHQSTNEDRLPNNVNAKDWWSTTI